MVSPTEIQVSEKYPIWIKYSDGTEGDVGLSKFAGKGLFTFGDEDNNFQKVGLDANGEIQWSDEFDLCSDTVYLQLTGKLPEELFPTLRATHIDT